MSHPPGAPDPDPAHDPWATPSEHSASRPPAGPPPYAAPPAYGPPQSYPAPFPAPSPVPRTNGKAQAALWSGLAMLLTSLCGVGLLGVVPIVVGVVARKEIGRSGGQQGGDGMALAGIVTGAVAIVLSLAVIALAVLLYARSEGGTTGYGTTGV